MSKKYNERVRNHRLIGMVANSKRQKLVLTVIAFALVGTGMLYFTQAAGPFESIESETGIITGKIAISENDQTASSNSFINFGAPHDESTGTFTESFGTLNHWTLAHWAVGNPATQNPRTTATIVNGHVVISNTDQNYGEATLRSDRMYDLRNGGTVTFDVSLGDGSLPATGAFIGFPYVAFADQPVNAPSYFDDNGKGTGPRNGGYYQFWHTCSIPWQAGHARQFVNYIETVIPGEETSCEGQVTQAEGQLNRVELRYNGDRGWEVWASNAGTTAPLIKLRSFAMQIPEVGYFIIGSHNHASLKYSNDTRQSANASFDNVSYPAAGFTATFHNGAGVTKGAATAAHVVFTGSTALTSRSFSVTVNGTVLPFTPFFQPSQSFPAAVEVPLSAVNEGNNTITVQGFDTTYDLDLVITRNSP